MDRQGIAVLDLTMVVTATPDAVALADTTGGDTTMAGGATLIALDATSSMGQVRSRFEYQTIEAYLQVLQPVLTFLLPCSCDRSFGELCIFIYSPIESRIRILRQVPTSVVAEKWNFRS